MPSERFMQAHYGPNGFVSKIDEPNYAAIVGDLVRKIYGDEATLGHYKLAIEAYKLGALSAQEGE